VKSVEIGERGERFRHWRVQLFPGNDAGWVQPHLDNLVPEIRRVREEAGFALAPDDITVTG
jgi:hypothetical protein